MRKKLLDGIAQPNNDSSLKINHTVCARARNSRSKPAAQWMTYLSRGLGACRAAVLRDRLHHLLIRGSLGLAVTVCAAGVISFLLDEGGAVDASLVTLAWNLVATLGVLTLIWFGLTLMFWINYRRTHADLGPAETEKLS
jgi:hypothetical protein